MDEISRQPRKGAADPDPDDREKQLDDLLLEAFALPEHEQRAFLEKACGDDLLLLEEALSCIELEENLGDFLEAPALGDAFEPALEQLAAGQTGRTSPARPAAEHTTGADGETLVARRPWTGASDEELWLRRLGQVLGTVPSSTRAATSSRSEWCSSRWPPAGTPSRPARPWSVSTPS